MSIIQFKEANCKNCYKCIRSCPVKAIAFNNEQAQIVQDDCMLCGRCLTVCPQNAKSVKSDVHKVKSFINKNEKVYASIAPSFISAFSDSDAKKIFGILKRLGFTNVEETAIGAVQVSLEYDRLMREKKMKNIITTACPSIVFLVQKYYPELINQLAPVVSPMIAHAKMMKNIYGSRIRVVFIGPCISKKEECSDLQNDGVVDAVITFEELEWWMETDGVGFDIDDISDINRIKNSTARFYPAPGGIIKTLDIEARKNYRCISIDGVDRCISILDFIKEGSISNYFVEMNSCTGGCLGGPCIRSLDGGFIESRDRLIGYVKKAPKDGGSEIVEDARVSLSKKFIPRTRKYSIPDEEKIREILSAIGKVDKDRELNCGACGYSTCRDKAIAVYNGKAELHMCLPYMRERAESFSNIIINSTPNAIIAMDTSLAIQEVNASAKELFYLKDTDAVGKSIYKFLECPDFQTVCETGENIIDKKYYYERYDKTVEQSVLFVKEHKIIIAVIKDITKEENQQQQMYKVRSQTVEIAQSVIEKQMRVAQEIASLLGETTAETKMILTKLKKSILSDMGEMK
ncbi:PAS domain S-box-containing protein [Anaerobacterium chartisolvens]|uniref:PAS domain S-box-containing protein n=1 Tax=Anaerobacterium chartisolvens TaxID=1297424 RepID=A0A369AJP1_9FIRM|nr:[Fe-Fe] hydrogenase large subunit C-terminal domain-containing protein [Anaerobacterium chartisolvens]RCX09629.1 PAS domain S-box-containing protein [Anaerobacterium chartisolvens]